MYTRQVNPEDVIHYAQLWRAVAALEPRRAIVVRMYTQGATFAECGAFLRVSGARARQLYRSAVCRLRHRRFGFPSDARRISTL